MSPTRQILRIVSSLILTFLLVTSGIVYAQNPPAGSEATNEMIKSTEHYQSGKEHLTQNNRGLAIEEFTKAIVLNPEYIDAYKARAKCYNMNKQKGKAVADYTAILKLKPQNKEIYNNRSAAYQSLGEFEKAISDRTKIIEINPEDLESYYNRGEFYERIGEIGKAIADFEMNLTIKPKHKPSIKKLAELRKKFVPSTADGFNQLGLSYSREGKHDEAIVQYTKAIELDGNLAEAYFNRGNANTGKGENEKVDSIIADYTKAIEIKPDYCFASAGCRQVLFKSSNVCPAGSGRSSHQ